MSWARLGALGSAAVLLAACTSNGSGGASSPPVSTPSHSTAPASTPSPPPSSSTPAPVTSSRAVSSTPPTPPPSSPSPVAHSTCTSLRIMAIQGGAEPNAEIEGLEFTNTGTRSCELVGYPTVTLLLRGKQIAGPSKPKSAAASQRTLAPGETAESLLEDTTLNCQAPLSDEIHVVAPGSTISTTRPAQLRACTLRVARLGPPD